MASTNMADEIAASMQQALAENTPPSAGSGHFSGVAGQLANTANELDSLGSPLAKKVDNLLNQMVEVVGGK